MGRKQKKKATQKEISQKIGAAENEEDKTGIECGCCHSLSCEYNGENSESNVMDLEEALKIKVEDQQRSFKEREVIYNEMISQMKGQIEILNGQIDKYQRLYNYATNRNKILEAEIIDLNEDPKKSNKKNEELEA